MHMTHTEPLTFIHPSIFLALLSIIHPPKPSEPIRSLPKPIFFSNLLVGTKLFRQYFLISTVQQSVLIYPKSLHSRPGSLITPDIFLDLESTTLSFLF